MLTLKDYEYFPKYPQVEYIPDGTVLRTARLARWYAYLKWRIENLQNVDIDGTIESAEYVFPEKEFHFKFKRTEMKFLPDFKVTYKNIVLPEYQTTQGLPRNQGTVIRTMLHYNPTLELRVIEPLEYIKIMKNLKKGDIKFDHLIKFLK
jgi:hypothetical protein